MIDYKCQRCEYTFCSENGIPYCPACECENLEEIEKNYKPIKEDIILEEHHIHPKFMNNKEGKGEKFKITKKQHLIIHGKIMNWIWEEICDEEKEEIIKVIITKSKEFIGVDNDKSN